MTLLPPEAVEACRHHAECWSPGNPFRAKLLARLGGLHAPSTVATDRSIIETEPAVALARENAELQASGEPVLPF